MKLRKNKKGFTIVELVIVIGVIGILSAILIPTFVNLTDNANKAAAKQEVSDAYSLYLQDALDGFVGGESADDGVAVSKTYTQAEVVIVRQDLKYTYNQNDGWHENTPEGFPTGYNKIVGKTGQPNADLKYNNCYVYTVA